MEDRQVIIITTESQLENTFLRFFQKYSTKAESEFESEKLTRTEAAKLAGVSLPTFLKMTNAGIFPTHGFRRKQFFLKSEVIAGLKNEADKI